MEAFHELVKAFDNELRHIKINKYIDHSIQTVILEIDVYIPPPYHRHTIPIYIIEHGGDKIVQQNISVL